MHACCVIYVHIIKDIVGFMNLSISASVSAYGRMLCIVFLTPPYN